MQNNILNKGAMVCVALAAVLSCAPKKRLPSSGDESRLRVPRIESKQILDAMSERQLAFVTFNGRAKSRVSINNDNYDVTANIRMERDKAIWISITALMGIEVGRVLITPDSVKIINRLQSGYIRKPFGYIHNFMSEELDFSSLQQLLVGNVIPHAAGRSTEVWATGEGYQLQGLVNDLLYTVQLDVGFHTVRTQLDEEPRRQRMELLYADYQESGGLSFPYQIRISIAAGRFNLRSVLDYSGVTYNEAVNMPFTIPPRYKEIQ